MRCGTTRWRCGIHESGIANHTWIRRGINNLTLFLPTRTFSRQSFMSEPTPNSPVPPGGTPKPPEAAKVQPKKETVRIALPPKPTASPTIKLPSLPAAGGAPAPAAAAPAAARPAAAPAPTAQVPRPAGAPAAPAAATAAPAPATRPGTAVARPTAPAPAKAPAPAAKPAAAPRTVGTLDTVLALVAVIICIGAVLSVLSLMFGPWEIK